MYIGIGNKDYVIRNKGSSIQPGWVSSNLLEAAFAGATWVMLQILLFAHRSYQHFILRDVRNWSIRAESIEHTCMNMFKGVDCAKAKKIHMDLFFRGLRGVSGPMVIGNIGDVVHRPVEECHCQPHKSDFMFFEVCWAYGELPGPMDRSIGDVVDWSYDMVPDNVDKSSCFLNLGPGVVLGC